MSFREPQARGIGKLLKTKWIIQKLHSFGITKGGTMLTDTKAASMAEYAVIAAIVIAVAVGVFGALGGKITNSIEKLNGSGW
jgi:Flp pilus assembly pilin Flp